MTEPGWKCSYTPIPIHTVCVACTSNTRSIVIRLIGLIPNPVCVQLALDNDGDNNGNKSYNHNNGGDIDTCNDENIDNGNINAS